MYKWYQSNSIVYISFNIPENVSKQDIHAEISNSSVALGVKGYGLNCEGSLYLNIKSSKWAIKDGSVQVQMDKQTPGKWSQLLSEVTSTNEKAIVLFDYEPTADEELSLFTHEVINVINKDESGWWEGSKLNLNGVFPINFCSEFPTDYQPPEDVELSNEVSKQEDTPISSVSRVGISMMGSMGSMDELKNKLINRKTATYNSQELEDAINSNKEDNNSTNESQQQTGFVAVQPSKSGAARPQTKILLNRQSQQINNPVNPIQPVQPVQPVAATVQLKSTKKEKEEKEKEKESHSTLSSSGSIPATTSKESQSTKESSDKKGITSLFKKPLKTIQAISALTGSHSNEEKSGSKSKARVLYDFETKEPNELPLKKGDIIVIIAKDSSGWWQGINQTTHAQGWFSNTFVEEIKETAPSTSEKPPKQVKSPPPKQTQPVVTAPAGTVEAKLQSLNETPKLESVKRVGAAKNRKPPSRVRASYLLSDEEREEREKLKQSFYSHVVATNRDIEDEDDNESPPPKRLSNSGSFSPPPSSMPIEKPSKPPPPKRNPNMTLSSSSNNLDTTTTTTTTPSKPPPSKPAPRPPTLAQQPISTNDENPSPLTTSQDDDNETVKPQPAQRSPPVSRKQFPLPPSTSPNNSSPPSSLNSSSNEVAVEQPNKPLLKPTPKPRMMPLPSSDNSNTTNEVNFKANLKPPPRSTSPPSGINTSQEMDQKPISTEQSQPTPFGLKKVPKASPSTQAPPPQQTSSELSEKLSKFSDLAENSDSNVSSNPTTPTKPVLKQPPTTEGGSVVTKPAVRPPLKKSAPQQQQQQQQQQTNTTSEDSTTPPQSSPPNTLNKPKVAPRAPQSSTTPSPNNLSPAPTSPLSTSGNSIKESGPPPLASPTTAKRNAGIKASTPAPAKPELEFSQVCQEIANICSEIEEKSNNSQESSTFKHIYPPLSESFFSVAVCSVDGQFWGNDDSINDQQIPMFQVIYPFLYSILCEEIGIEEVSKYIDDEIKKQSDINPINNQKKPHNPFTLAGRLVTAYLFTTKYPNAITRIYQFLSIVQQLVNSSTVSCDMISYLSQKQDSSDEMLVAHLLKSSGLIKQPEEALEFFYQLNSIQLNSKQISVLAATLASEGICPFSPQLKLAPKNIINNTNEILKRCDTTLSTQIDNLSSKIIPILSDSGILMLVVPNLMGITLISPCIFNSSPTATTTILNDNHIKFINNLNNILK